jgi:hypothetical protein
VCGPGGREVCGDLEAGRAGEHDAEDEEIEAAGGGDGEALAAVERLDDVAVLGEALAEQGRHTGFVLDYQNLHRLTESLMVRREPEDFL